MKQRRHPCYALYEYLNHATEEPSEMVVFFYVTKFGLLHSNSKAFMCIKSLRKTIQ